MTTQIIKAGKTNKSGRPQSLPTPKQLASFAKRFTVAEWSKLTCFQDFLDIFTVDLFGAGIMAEMILSGKYDKSLFGKKVKAAKENPQPPATATA